MVLWKSQRGTEFHLLFDETSRPSVKDFERNKRDDNRHVTYQLVQNKNVLISSKRPRMVQRISVNPEDMCFSLCNEDGLIVKRIEQEGRCSNKEPCSRMLFHLLKYSCLNSLYRCSYHCIGSFRGRETDLDGEWTYYKECPSYITLIKSIITLS